MPVPLGDWCVWSARRPPTHPPTHGAAPGARRRDVDACSPKEEQPRCHGAVLQCPPIVW